MKAEYSHSMQRRQARICFACTWFCSPLSLCICVTHRGRSPRHACDDNACMRRLRPSNPLRVSSRCAMSCIFTLCDVLHLHVTVVPCRAEPQVGRDRPGQLRELPDPVRDLPGQVRELPDQVRKLPDRVRPRLWPTSAPGLLSAFAFLWFSFCVLTPSL